MKNIDIAVQYNIIGTFKKPINSDEYIKVVGWVIENDTIFLDIKVDETI